MERRAFLGAALAWPFVAQASSDAVMAYVGSYTKDAPGGGGSLPPIGIAAFAATSSGALELVQSVPSANPSWLALDPRQRFLYAVNELDDYEGKPTGSAEAYAIENGRLRLLNRRAVGGAIPAHAVVDPTGRFLVIANYGGGSVTVLPIFADGSLGEVCSERRHSGKGPVAKRQESPHVHQVVLDPAGKHFVSVDLGTDTIEVCHLDDKGTLTKVSEVALPPGAGPRHVTFDKRARFAWVVTELSGMLLTLPYDARRGILSAPTHEVSLVPDGFTGTKSGAEIALHPSGHLLYASHRGPDAASFVASFTVEPRSGALALLERTTAGIAYPRSFTIEPNGKRLYVCNQHGDHVVALSIDARGRLHPAGSTTTPTPCCLVLRR